MSEMAISFIRECTKRGLIDFSEHSIIRMTERELEKDRVIECIVEGKVIESQEHSQDIIVLFQEATETYPEFYVVVAAAYPYPEVLTVCRFKKEAWEYSSGLMRRRKKYGHQ
ncbi:MAG: DUF4258 domain-containing protein [Clostridia bacterium]